jgi:H+/Cl- antiporter ClcA
MYKLNQKTMNRFFYFKVTFLSITAGLFAGMLVYGLFDVDFSNNEALIKLLLKSLFTAIGTGLIMGILNMFFKIGNFQRKENS